MLNIFQGETMNIKVDVKDAEGAAAILTSAEAIFAYQKGTAAAITKTCTIENNIVSVKLDSEDTDDMLGEYKFEFKLKDYNGDIDTIAAGTFKILSSIVPNYGQSV